MKDFAAWSNFLSIVEASDEILQSILPGSSVNGVLAKKKYQLAYNGYLTFHRNSYNINFGVDSFKGLWVA